MLAFGVFLWFWVGERQAWDLGERETSKVGGGWEYRDGHELS
jgi:hypothetical protein